MTQWLVSLVNSIWPCILSVRAGCDQLLGDPVQLEGLTSLLSLFLWGVWFVCFLHDWQMAAVLIHVLGRKRERLCIDSNISL